MPRADRFHELSNLHGVNPDRALEALHAFLQLLVPQVEEALGALGARAAVPRQLPGLVVVGVVAEDVSKQAVQTGRFFFLQLLPEDFLCLEITTERTKLLFFKDMYIFYHI